ncbi:MAG: 3-hydroxyacyl-ACP dehydratase FabZ [Alphaproteobacteria bacterium]
MKPVLTQKQIEKVIPHRAPMLLVENVWAWEAYKTLHATQTFVAKDPIFKGHFPNHPVVPGVLVVESLAQAAAILTNLSLGAGADNTLFLFMGIENARFKKPVLPDDALHLHVTMTKHKAGVFWFEAKAVVNGATHAEASFAAKVVKKDA